MALIGHNDLEIMMYTDYLKIVYNLLIFLHGGRNNYLITYKCKETQ